MEECHHKKGGWMPARQVWRQKQVLFTSVCTLSVQYPHILLPSHIQFYFASLVKWPEVFKGPWLNHKEGWKIKFSGFRNDFKAHLANHCHSFFAHNHKLPQIIYYVFYIMYFRMIVNGWSRNALYNEKYGQDGRWERNRNYERNEETWNIEGEVSTQI